MPKQSQAELVASIRADQQVWRDLVDEVGGENMNEPGPMGEWTFKDLAVHLAGWRNYRVEVLEAAARGEPAPPTPWPADLDDDEPINQWLFDQSRDLPLEDALESYNSSFTRLAAALEALPESTLADPNAFDWADGEPLLDLTFIGHLHEEHLPAVRAWLDSR